MANGTINNTQDMRTDTRANVVSSDTRSEIANPQSNTEVFYGSFASILMQNLGQYVVVEFLVGTNRLEIKEGILYSSGINFLSLYDPLENRYIVCDLYAVKFVTFYNTTTVPPSRMRSISQVPMGNNNSSGNVGMSDGQMMDHNDMDTNCHVPHSGVGMNRMRGSMRMF